MAESDDFFRAAVLASRTVKRLERQGHSATEAKRLVVSVIDSEEKEVVHYRHSFDAARFIRRLEQLPDAL